MPHINHRRGETRTFVVRKNNWSTRKTYQPRYFGSNRLKSGLCPIEMWMTVGFGGPFCTCCTMWPIGAREWKQYTHRYNRRVTKKEAIKAGLLEYEEE